MAQNLSDYFMLDATINGAKCVQEMIELSSMSQVPWLELKQDFRRSLINYKDEATIKNCKKRPRGGMKLASCFP